MHIAQEATNSIAESMIRIRALTSGLIVLGAIAIAAHAAEPPVPPPQTPCGTLRGNGSNGVTDVEVNPVITTPTTMLQLVRRLHEGFGATDGRFIRHELLKQLFPQGEITQSWPFGTNDTTTWKNIKFSLQSELAGSLNLSSADREHFIWGTVHYKVDPANTSFTADLVEKYLVPNSLGKDPFGPGTVPATNETFDSMSRRPRPTHPKGYFEYWDIRKTSTCESKLYVRLNQNGLLWTIDLSQESK